MRKFVLFLALMFAVPKEIAHKVVTKSKQPTDVEWIALKRPANGWLQSNFIVSRDYP